MKRQRLPIILLALCMLMSMFFVSAAAAEVTAQGTCGEDLTWVLDIDGTLTISGTGPMSDYYTEDGGPWSAYKSSLYRVVIEEGVTSIGDRAFVWCTRIVSISVPDSVVSIGDTAFMDCDALAEVQLGNGLETIGKNAFMSCNSLEVLVLPESVTSIKSGAFQSCNNLKHMRIPDGVTKIENGWFGSCESLKTLSLPAGITSIGYSVFRYCDSLTDVYFAGTQAQWDAITVDPVDPELNAPLYEAALHVGHVHKWEANETGGYTCDGCACSKLAGSAAAELGVSRIYGATRYATAFKAADTLKAQLGIEKFDTIVVADGTNFADALSGSYLASVKNAPILLVRDRKQEMEQVKAYIKENLVSGGTVYLLGGVNAVPKAMESGIDGFTVKRLGGSNRYETNLLILKEAGVGNKDILICTGKDFADSLSASAAKLPILLVKDSLLSSQKDFLKGTKGAKIIIGGTSAVSAKVETALKDYGTVERLGGKTRYDTSVLVAQKFFSAPDAIVLAYAQNFPDGLCGGALAAGMDAPLILTASGKDAAAAKYAKEQGINSGFALGGPTLISDKAVRNIFQMAADDPIK